MGNGQGFKFKRLLTLVSMSMFFAPALNATLCFNSLAGNTVIEDPILKKDTPTFRLGIEDLTYLGDTLALNKKNAEGSPRYPEIKEEFDEMGMAAAGTLKNWRMETFSSLINMEEAKFNRILGDAIDIHRNDRQFTSVSRPAFLHAIDTWILARETGNLGVQNIAEERIIAETIGKSREKDGVDFQPIQADFRNMMTLTQESELRAQVPRVAMPVVLSAFLYRNFRTRSDTRLTDGEGSIGGYVDQYMLGRDATSP